MRTNTLLLPGKENSQILCDKVDCKFKEFHRNNPKLKSFQEKVEKDAEFQKHFNSNMIYRLPCHQDLTPIGIQRLIYLGEFLKDVYLTDLKLESSRIQPKHIKAFTNGKTVAAKSSLAVLFGFLPDYLLSKLKTRAISETLCAEKDRLSHISCNCPDLYRTEKKYRVKILHGTSTSLKNPVSPSDIWQIISNVCHSPNHSCFTPKEIDHSELVKHIDEVNTFHKIISSDPFFIDFVNVYLYPFLDHLIHSFRQGNSVFEKLFYYSVDENFLYYMLHVLNFPMKSWPRPGSRIVFELYKKSGQIFQPYYIRILYNGANMSRFVSLCNINMEDGLCRLKNFAELLHYKTVKQEDLKSAYESFCST